MRLPPPPHPPSGAFDFPLVPEDLSRAALEFPRAADDLPRAVAGKREHSHIVSELEIRLLSC